MAYRPLPPMIPMSTFKLVVSLARYGQLLNRVLSFDVLVQHANEGFDDAVAAQRGNQLSVHIDWRNWFLERPRQGDADVGVLGFTRAVHHTAHHRDLHFLDTGVLLFPDGHLPAQVTLNVV